MVFVVLTLAARALRQAQDEPPHRHLNIGSSQSLIRPDAHLMHFAQIISRRCPQMTRDYADSAGAEGRVGKQQNLSGFGGDD
jgi:hypothetical protein